MKKPLIIITILLLAGLTLFAYSKRGPNEKDYKSTVPPTDLSLRVEKSPPSIPTSEPLEDKSTSDSIQQTPTLPSKFNLDVPFFPQAPDADWSMPWQEACEEAASILAYYYVTDTPLDKELFKQKIQDLVSWQNTNYGDFKHTTIDQTARMIKEVLNYSDFQILENPTIKQLKEELAKGNVIVAPFAGRELKNPFYSGIGPVYHMMVIKGYDEKNFITNDVGTKRGKDFIYPYNTIMSAMHDYDKVDMNLGEKKVIVMK